MNNLEWVRMKECERILRMPDNKMISEIVELASPNLCKYCEELFGECCKDDIDNLACDERMGKWATGEHIDLEYKGYYGIHVYHEEEQLYKGLIMTFYSGRFISFYGKTPDELYKKFCLAVDEYKNSLENVDEELDKMKYSMNIHLFRFFRKGGATAICTCDKKNKCWNGLFFSGFDSVTITRKSLEELPAEFDVYAMVEK